MTKAHIHFPGCCITPDEVEEELPAFVITTPYQRVDDIETLSSTQKAIVLELRDIGFLVRVGRSVTLHRETFYVSGDKAGELKKGEHEQENVFVAAKFPKSLLACYAVWLDGKFGSRVLDPAGKFAELRGDYTFSKEMRDFLTEPRAVEREEAQRAEYNDGYQMRVTRWDIDGSKEFQAWLDDWRKLIKGKSRREEKEEKAQALLDRKRAKQSAIYKLYLDEEGVEYDDADFE